MPATKKLVTLSSDEIAAKLDAEPNMSAVVEAVLARHYGLPLEGEGLHIDQRREVLESLGDYPLTYTEPTPGPMLTEEAPEDVAAEEFITAHEQPLEDQQVSVENPVETGDNPTEWVEAPVAEILPVYEEVAPIEEAPVGDVLAESVTDSTPEVESQVIEEPGFVAGTTLSPEDVAALPDAEPVVAPESDGELQINVMGQAGNVCDIHGPYIGSICIDCL